MRDEEKFKPDLNTNIYVPNESKGYKSNGYESKLPTPEELDEIELRTYFELTEGLGNGP